MQNLREKLLQAGLVSEDQTKRAEVESQRPKARPPVPRSDPSPRRNGPPPPRRDEQRRAEPAAAPIPKLPPLALPGSKAHQRMQALKQQELDKKLRDLVFPNQVAIEPGTRTFHFATRKGKLRRLELSDAQGQLLEEGKLAVVERQEPACIEHSLVPSDIAEKMLVLLEKSVRFYNRGGAPVGCLSDEDVKSGEMDDEMAAESEEPAAG